MSLRQKSISAASWSAADVLLRQGLSFLVSLTLARLLTPEEFGTIGVLIFFTGIASAFSDSGLSAALIQRQDTTHTDESTVFWFNLGMGSLVAALLWAAAPLLATFYHLPVLVPLTAVLALNVIIIAIGSIHCTLLTKRLDFKTQMAVGVITTVVSGAVAIVMAMSGFKVWALAAQILVATFITTLSFWIVNKWRPALVFSLHSARRLFGFGGYVLAAGLLDVTYSYVHSILIGKYYGVRELGLYERADSIRQVPIGALSHVLSSVTLPILSAAVGDPDRLHRGARSAVRIMMFINVPLMLGLAVSAEPMVIVLLGERWRQIVPIFEILCVGSLFWPIYVINVNALAAKGLPNLYFRLAVTTRILGCCFVAAGIFFGIMGVAWSHMAFNIASAAISAGYTSRHLGYGLAAQLRDFLPTLVISSAMACGMVLFASQVDLPPIYELVLLVAVGGSIFVALSSVFQFMLLKQFLDLILTRKPISLVH